LYYIVYTSKCVHVSFNIRRISLLNLLLIDMYIMKFDMQPRIVNNFITSRKKKKKSTLSRGSRRTSLKTSVWYVRYNTISFLKFWSILIDRINCTCSDEIILRHASNPAMYLIQNIKYTHTLGTSEIRKQQQTLSVIFSPAFFFL
jgi:hypothetical protein